MNILKWKIKFEKLVEEWVGVTNFQSNIKMPNELTKDTSKEKLLPPLKILLYHAYTKSIKGVIKIIKSFSHTKYIEESVYIHGFWFGLYQSKDAKWSGGKYV